MKQTLLWAATAVTLLFGIYYAVTGHFNFGNLCVWLLGAALLCYTLLWKKIDPFLLHTLPGRILLGVLIAGCLFFVFVLGVILSGQMANCASGEEKTLIVLGCSVNGETPSRVLRCRLEAALAYYEKNPAVTVVVCGGQGPEETAAEGRVMKNWLMENGVPKERILVDDTSTSTEENFRNARALLAEHGIEADAPAAFATNGFHCWRAARYAAQEGFSNIKAVPAALPPMQIFTCYVREVFAVVYYWAFKSPDTGFLAKYVGFLHIMH